MLWGRSRAESEVQIVTRILVIRAEAESLAEMGDGLIFTAGDLRENDPEIVVGLGEAGVEAESFGEFGRGFRDPARVGEGHAGLIVLLGGVGESVGEIFAGDWGIGQETHSSLELRRRLR
jgi:hypothetical protein